MPAAPVADPDTATRGSVHDRLVTLLGWLLVVAGGLLLPVAGITLLMLVARSYGTAGANLGGVLLIVGGPPGAVVAGIGLIRRWRWAHPTVTLAAAVVAVVHFIGVLRGPVDGSSRVLPSGTRVTHSPTGPRGSGAVAMTASAVFFWFLSPAVRRRFRGPDRRRNLPEPSVDCVAEGPPIIPPSGPRAVPMPRPWAIPAVLIAPFLASGFFLWLAAGGISSGRIHLPSRRGGTGHTVDRTRNPGVFWASVGFHSVAATGCAGLAVFVLRLRLRA